MNPLKQLPTELLAKHHIPTHETPAIIIETTCPDGHTLPPHFQPLEKSPRLSEALVGIKTIAEAKQETLVSKFRLIALQTSYPMFLIAEERLRQVKRKGFDCAHDDEHTAGEMSAAAACYALPNHRCGDVFGTPLQWPEGWSTKWWKPSPNDRIRELVKAGALIVAEIERLQRLAEKGGAE